MTELQQQEQLKQQQLKQQQEQQSKQQQEKQKQEYNRLVKKITPQNNLPLQMAKAFLVGGIICVVGQGILEGVKAMGVDKETAGTWCSIILVLISAILTGLSLYQPLASFGGAGALVPITGFANSVCAPAVEFQTEGQVFGVGVKIFTIAGPVILYGIFSSWVLGLIYLLGKLYGAV
ncbi:MAG: SpoVA/SpoVAEb family sporulation membrane protein [Lachnospiraceae bacterium]|nr:SpoVA/SpoVAEb family sporulation membrane protein [Lachnospiraceae bacterium]